MICLLFYVVILSRILFTKHEHVLSCLRIHFKPNLRTNGYKYAVLFIEFIVFAQ
jgi:hypothetical protein